jgi:Protein of unknown function (DUF1236)
MNRKLPTLYGALLASTLIAASAFAQNSGNNATSPNMMMKQGGNAAMQATPGQMQNSGQANSPQQGNMQGNMQQPQTGQNMTTQQPNQPAQQTGQAAQPPGTSNETTGSINITDQQRSEVKQMLTGRRMRTVQPNFDVNVGATVPNTVRLHRLPARAVRLVPAYRRHDYFVLADGRVVIVDPSSKKIVSVVS